LQGANTRAHFTGASATKIKRYITLTPAQQVEALSGLGICVDGLLEVLNGERDSNLLVAEAVNAVKHPTQLPVDVRLQVGGQIRLLQQLFVYLPRPGRISLDLVKVSHVKADLQVGEAARTHVLLGQLEVLQTHLFKTRKKLGKISGLYYKNMMIVNDNHHE